MVKETYMNTLQDKLNSILKMADGQQRASNYCYPCYPGDVIALVKALAKAIEQRDKLIIAMDRNAVDPELLQKLRRIVDQELLDILNAENK